MLVILRRIATKNLKKRFFADAQNDRNEADMYIPIGGDMAVRERSIIGIFDLDNCSYGKKTREFLAKAEQNGEVVAVMDDLPKSFVLTAEYGFTRIYLTQFNAATIERRSIRP